MFRTMLLSASTFLLRSIGEKEKLDKRKYSPEKEGKEWSALCCVPPPGALGVHSFVGIYFVWLLIEEIDRFDLIVPLVLRANARRVFTRGFLKPR